MHLKNKTIELILQCMVNLLFYLLNNMYINYVFLLGRHYSLQYPNKEFITGRNLRMSPIYPKLKEAGAVFEQVMGYERPSWFDPDLAKGTLHLFLIILCKKSILYILFYSTFVW